MYEADYLEVREISITVEDLLVIESNHGLPALDLESVLLLEKGAKALGKVFHVIGPLYVVRFNSEQHVREGRHQGDDHGVLRPQD